MEILKGIPVSPGIYIGEAFLLEGEEVRIPQRYVAEDKAESERARLSSACAKVIEELDSLRTATETQLGTNLAAILSVQTQLLKDPSLRKRIQDRIDADHWSAEFAVAKTLRDLAKLMARSQSEMFSHRASDIYDLEKRLLRQLIGEKGEDIDHLRQSVALVAHDLGPSQTAALDRTKVMAIALDVGGRTSHTSILARAYEIPAVVGLETITTSATGGDKIIIDGNRGIVIVGPNERTLERYRKIQAEFQAFGKTLIRDKDLPAVTTDGREIHVMANIEFPEEVSGALAHGASGIGLFRTEFLYLRGGLMPSENDHFEAYRQSLAQLRGHPLIVRTLDLGADKADPQYGAIEENNPTLGLRSIRLSMKRPESFRMQIRAILRASALGKLRLLLPMITSLEELRWAKDVIEDSKRELREKNLPFDERIEIGIMIEVPSAALQASSLVRECDYVSIGTNDLIQYTLAVDRGNEHVAHLYDPCHPAILQIIKMIVDAAQQAEVPAGMCGEMAGDPIFTIPLLGMGLSEFSVAPPAIPQIKDIARSTSYERCKQVAKQVLALKEATAINEFLRAELNRIKPGEEQFRGS